MCFCQLLCVLSASPTVHVALRVDAVKNPQAAREGFFVCSTSSTLAAVSASSKYSIYGGTWKLE